MDPKKVAAIADRARPQNFKDVERFVGLANDYRRYVINFSGVAQPLFSLFKKDVKFKWTQDEEFAFQQLTTKHLTSYPVLLQPDFTKIFYVYCDASGYCLGVIIAQIDEAGNQVIVACLSLLLKGAEIHYLATKLECPAVIFGIKQNRQWLHGRHFNVITDHAALRWLMSLNLQYVVGVRRKKKQINLITLYIHLLIQLI